MTKIIISGLYMEMHEFTKVEEPIKTEKKSNKLYYLVAIVVVFFASYYFLTAHNIGEEVANDESNQLTNNENKVPDGKGGSGLVTAGRYGTAGGQNLWKNSQDLFTVQAPVAWEVHQIDAGPVSIVEIYEPNNPGDSITLWVQAVKMDFEDITLSFDDWILGSTENMTEVKECEGESLGGIVTTCRTGFIGSAHWQMYFGQINDDYYTGIYKPVAEQGSGELWSVIKTINFKPSASDIENAIIIP